jgi:hypothetical protein
MTAAVHRSILGYTVVQFSLPSFHLLPTSASNEAAVTSSLSLSATAGSAIYVSYD